MALSAFMCGLDYVCVVGFFATISQPHYVTAAPIGPAHTKLHWSDLLSRTDGDSAVGDYMTDHLLTFK